MKFNKLEYNLNVDFVPLNIRNFNKLIIKKTNYTGSYKIKTNENINLIDTNILNIENLFCTWKKVYKVQLNYTLDFVPGDSIGLLCSNNDLLVNEMLSLLEMSGDTLLYIEQIGKTGFQFEGSLRDFFKYIFDFTSLPKKAWLMDISKTSKNKHDIEYLCSKEGVKDYLSIIKNWNNVLDIIYTFQCKPSLEDLIMNCQTIKPRYYSLTNHVNEKCEILVAIIKKGDRYGHVSNFIDMQNYNNLKICHRPSKLFRLNFCKKVLGICTGTGIAPFFSFLKNKEDDQYIKLIYGFRNQEDDLIKDAKYKKTEIIKILSCNKIYVTDYLLQNLNKIKTYIKDGCLVYVCGRPDMQKTIYSIFNENFSEIVKEKRLFFDSWI